MPKHLYKVQKQIAKKKGAISSLHEKSRDAKRLRRAGARSEKLEKLASDRQKSYQPYLQRIAFFQTAAQEATASFTLPTLQSLIETYLSRDSAEMSTLQSQRRPGRPTSTQEDKLRQRIDAEAKEYASGFWIPDLTHDDVSERIQSWNGEWTSLNTLKYIRIKQDGTSRASSFPPKGES